MNIEMTFSNAVDTKYDSYEAYYLSLAETIFSYLKLDGYFIFDVDLVDQDTIHEVNRTYRNIDRVTDVISFAFEDNDDLKDLSFDSSMPRSLGQILICVDRAHEQANEYGHSFEREMAFLFTHGLLHLLGYDHMCEDDEKEMFGIQNEIMKIMKL